MSAHSKRSIVSRKLTDDVSSMRELAVKVAAVSEEAT